MSVIDSITKARERGASDDMILMEIGKQNPAKQRTFEEAFKRGAEPANILEEILKQNTVQEPVVPVQEPQRLSGVTQAVKAVGGGALNAVSGVATKAISATSEFEKGAAKGLGSTIFGLGKLGETLLRPTVGRAVEKITGKKQPDAVFTEKPDMLTPKGGIQKAGFVTEQIAEFLLPSGQIAKTIKGAPLLGRAAVEGLVSGGIALGQKGQVDDDVKTTAIIGALFPIAGAALKEGGKLLGKGLVKAGEKIQFSKIKPAIRDVSEGFKIENLKKYNIGGNLQEMLAKTNIQMNRLSNTLKDLTGGQVPLNLQKSYGETAIELTKGKGATFGEIKKIRGVLLQLSDEIDEVAQGRVVPLFEAQKVKQGAGLKGSWAYGRTDPDANAIEKVYSTFYRHLKEQIEQVAPDGVQGINKQLSELIPINNAIVRRIPVEMRNEALSLTDKISVFGSVFNPKSLALLGANKLSRSGKFARTLVRAGESLQGNPKSALGQRVFGGNIKDLKNQPAGLSMVEISPDTILKEIKTSASAEGVAKEVSMTTKAGYLLPKAAEGRIKDIAGKLDLAFPGKGLGNKFFGKVNPLRTTFKELENTATQLIEGAKVPRDVVGKYAFKEFVDKSGKFDAKKFVQKRQPEFGFLKELEDFTAYYRGGSKAIAQRLKGYSKYAYEADFREMLEKSGINSNISNAKLNKIAEMILEFTKFKEAL